MIPVVFINCSRFPFLAWILALSKLYETRTRNTLRALVGQRVYLAMTGKGKPVVLCSVVIGDPVVIRSRKAFAAFRKACRIARGSQYDWKRETKVKYLYPLLDVRPVAPFVPPEGVRHGRVWMEYYPKKMEVL